MREAKGLLTWVVMVATVASGFYLASGPDVEAALGVPACAGMRHAGPCRICSDQGRCRLPGVIDGFNVRLSRAGGDTGAGEPGF